MHPTPAFVQGKASWKENRSNRKIVCQVQRGIRDLESSLEPHPNSPRDKGPTPGYPFPHLDKRVVLFRLHMVTIRIESDEEYVTGQKLQPFVQIVGLISRSLPPVNGNPNAGLPDARTCLYPNFLLVQSHFLYCLPPCVLDRAHLHGSFCPGHPSGRHGPFLCDLTFPPETRAHTVVMISLCTASLRV